MDDADFQKSAFPILAREILTAIKADEAARSEV